MSEEQATYQCSLSAQELRIGNWVYDGERTQFPMQVVALGKDWAHLDFPGNEGDLWEADIKDLRPISVTEEILKKAGFKWDGGYGHKRLDENKTMQYYKHEPVCVCGTRPRMSSSSAMVSTTSTSCRTPTIWRREMNWMCNPKIVEKDEKYNKSYNLCYSGSTISQYWAI